jgi:hypothetical protein
MKKKARLSGIALSLSLSDWSWRQLVASMQEEFPRASRQEVQQRIHEYLYRLEAARQRMRFQVPR